MSGKRIRRPSGMSCAWSEQVVRARHRAASNLKKDMWGFSIASWQELFAVKVNRDGKQICSQSGCLASTVTADLCLDGVLGKRKARNFRGEVSLRSFSAESLVRLFKL